MKKKRIVLFTAVLCILPLVAGVFGWGDTALAAPKDIKVTLHKKQMDEFPDEDIKNTGKIDDRFDHYKPLNGVSFKVWDITQQFHEKVNQAETGTEDDAAYQALLNRIMKDFNPDVTSEGTSAVAGETKTTEGEGTAEFILPDRGTDGIYKVYYFEELTGGPTVVQQSQKLILALPILDENEQALTDIHLYPKNKVDPDSPEKEVVDGEGSKIPENTNGVYDYDIGAKIHYRVAFTMPSQIGQVINVDEGTDKQTRYTHFAVKDEVSKEGLKFEGITGLKVDGVEKTLAEVFPESIAALATTGSGGMGELAGFTITTNLNAGKETASPADFLKSKAAADHLHQFAGQKIEIFYDVSITENTPVDEEIDNDFTVTIGQNGGATEDQGVPEDQKPDPVITGGKKFFKVEAGKTTQGLQGAEFVIIKALEGQDNYLTVNGEGRYEWKVVDDAKEYPGAKKIVSDNDGKFEIIGLDYGTYGLRETKAPNGFKLLTADQAFVVDKDSYAGAAAEVDLVENISKSGFLPSTGGKGILIFLVIGLSLMGFALIHYRKVQQAM